MQQEYWVLYFVFEIKIKQRKLGSVCWIKFSFREIYLLRVEPEKAMNFEPEILENCQDDDDDNNNYNKRWAGMKKN